MVRQDLYRYTGKRDTQTLIRTFLRNRAFRRVVYYRYYDAPGPMKYVVRVLNRVLAKKQTIDLPPTAKIGPGLLFLHPHAITINSKAVVGKNLTMFKGANDLKKNVGYAANIKVRTDAVEAYKERKFIPLFKDYVGYEALHEGSKKYDAVVVGSDQVWTPLSLPTKFFNLLFVDDKVRKVAYASSFGVSSIPGFQQKATGAFLDRFHAIGVREQSGKKIVDSLSHQTATVVADPTMLLDHREWSEEIKDLLITRARPTV